MNYDLDTEQGMANAKIWTQGLIDNLKDGGTWIVPRSGTMVQVFKDRKEVRIVGLLPDLALGRVFEAMGYRVIEARSEA